MVGMAAMVGMDGSMDNMVGRKVGREVGRDGLQTVCHELARILLPPGFCR